MLGLLLIISCAGPDAEGPYGWADTASGDSAASPRCDPVQALDAAPLEPAAGELYYAQLGLGGIALGEAAVVVGPTGDRLLIDVGNDSHDDDVYGALAALGGAWTDHVLLTHFHADHADGLEDLADDVQIHGRVIHRGLADLDDANPNTVEKLQGALAGLPGAEVALCDDAGCPGLDAGDLSAGDPTAGGGPSWLPLGGAAQLDLIAADGQIAGARFDGGWGDDASNRENARGVVAALRHGRFRLLVSGDLTGGGDGTPDMEGFLIPWLGSASDLDDRGVDVLHAGHHGRRTSSSQAWVEALLPDDGLDRGVVMGISAAHLGSPHEEPLEALLSGDRLGDGYAWATTRAAGGADHERLIDAGGGEIRIRTDAGGDAWIAQALDGDGVPLRTIRYASARSCN